MNEFILKSIGIPWVDRGRDRTGWDCWGLVVNFYKEVFKIDINKYENTSCCENQKEALKTLEMEVKNWTRYNLGEEKIGDIILLRPLHSGIVIEKGKFLHCLSGINTCIERYNFRMWKPRLIGFYRHAKFAE